MGDDKNMSVVGTISAAAAKRGLERIVEDIYSTAKSELQGRLKRWKAKGSIDLLYTKIKDIRRVKTILQPEKAVDLLSFYYPSKLIVGGNPVMVKDLSDLDTQGNIVVQGTAGQGKSMFFRYLASREMVKGGALPLFVELRRVGRSESLVEHLVQEAGAIGLKGLDQETFLWLAEHGKLVVLLDGFDETAEDERIRLVTEIERFARTNEKTRILVSSRPNSGIENSSLFSVLRIAHLQEDEYEQAIRCMAEPAIADEITKAAHGSKSHIGELLSTPLMVALLIVRHRVEQTIPENVVGFYDGLFGLLISRHDKMKGGYTRPRRSGLGDNTLQDIFEGMCFLVKKRTDRQFTRRDLTRWTRESMTLTDSQCDPDAVVEDIIKITCLILEEGGECRFIHKSVGEYYTACFIKSQPDELAREFYASMQRLPSIGVGWDTELDFLSMIDKYRFSKWLLIPATCQMFGFDEQGIPDRLEIDEGMIDRAFNGLGRRRFEKKHGGWFIPMNSPCGRNHQLFFLSAVSVFGELTAIEQLMDARAEARSQLKAMGGCSIIPFLSEGIGRKWAEDKLGAMHSRLVAANDFVREVEARRRIFEF